MTQCVAIIPARFASTRLPGKPLLQETGKYLIQHVYEQVAAARKVDRILVATDDERIRDGVARFGGEAVMTSVDHASGTDRIAEVAAGLDAELILNVQGDEPDMDPALLDRLAEHLAAYPGDDMATAAVPIVDDGSFTSPHVVKVVLDGQGRALYFSRAPIPHQAGHVRGVEPLKHIGVYGFQRKALLAFTKLTPAPLEKQEKLEQLRALHHGMTIRVLITDKDHHGIDTPEEYRAFVENTNIGKTGKGKP
jgi:3-deoxy-manno-octulosonate cytidylyltransferase (CMP-KDO synthetase)